MTHPEYSVGGNVIEMPTIEKSKGEIEICDGCGWIKKIVLIDEYGKGFCKDCMKDNKPKIKGVKNEL